MEGLVAFEHEHQQPRVEAGDEGGDEP